MRGRRNAFAEILPPAAAVSLKPIKVSFAPANRRVWKRQGPGWDQPSLYRMKLKTLLKEP
jgi:hypothetical protein